MSHMHGTRRSWMVAPAILVLGIAGCQSEDPEQVVDDVSTPAPVDDWFHMSTLAIAAESTSIDIDDDGTPDDSSGIQDALDAINVAILAAVDTALAESTVPVDCSGEEPCQQDIHDAVAAILDEALSVDAISDALSQPVEDGDVNYLLHFAGIEGGTLNLSWAESTLGESGYSVSSELGSQTGSLSSTGDGSFSADELVLTFTLEAEDPRGNTEPIENTFTLYDWATMISSYSSTGLNFVSGVAVTEEDILTITEDLLTTINQLVLAATGEPIDIDGVLADVSAALEGYLNVDVDGNGVDDGLAFIVEGQAEAIEVVEAQ